MLQGDKLDSDAEAAPSRRLTELLATALLDQELGERLFADPEAVARAFDLPAAEAAAIRLLDRVRFEQTIARIRWG
jgi:hypothetical protein